MPIVARCACGNKMGVGDALAGRTIRCAKCGAGVLVPTAGAGASGGRAGQGAAVLGKSPAAVAAARKAAAANPAVTVSPGLLIGGGVGLVLLAVVLVFYFGPWRVGSQWAAMAPRASTDVTDVVMFAMQAHQSHAGLGGGPLVRPPAIEGPPLFVPPYMAFNMPRRIIVNGRTSQGGYIGTWDTVNGEVNVTIDVGGYSVGGLVAMRKPTGTIHVTGREKAGVVTAEEDGEPMTVVVPKYKGKFDE